MLDLSKPYRLKALECEKLGRDASSVEIKRAWADIAIEWHALAARMTFEASKIQTLVTN